MLIVKRNEKFASKKTGAKIRVLRVFENGNDSVAMVATMDDKKGRSIQETLRLVLVDSIRRKYKKL